MIGETHLNILALLNIIYEENICITSEEDFGKLAGTTSRLEFSLTPRSLSSCE